MKKKAFINIILLGFILITSVIVFLSTTSDDIVWKNKYFNLKKITDSTALALAKSYNINQYELDPVSIAQGVADNILNNSNLGSDASDYMTYSWCFKNPTLGIICSDKCGLNPECGGTVSAIITNYQHDNFWYKFLGKDQFTFEEIKSTAQVLSTPLDTVPDNLPIAVNGCTQDYPVGTEFDFMLSAHDIYTDIDNDSFFALSEPGGGQSSFAHFKNTISDILDDKESNFDLNTTTTISNVLWDDVDNDVKQVSQSFDITTLEDTHMSIIVLDCNSTATDLKIQKILPIKLTDVYCAPNVADLESAILNGDDLFAEPNPFWFKTVPSCNSTSYFRIHFEVTDRTNDTQLEGN